MPTQVINQSGPLPIKVSVSPEATGPATLVVAGSVWTQKQNALIGIAVSFEGRVIGEAKIWSNAPATHRAVVTQHLMVDLDKDWSGGQPAAYEVSLTAMNGDTIGDKNDYYSVTLVP